jgi:hypothetical protein
MCSDAAACVFGCERGVQANSSASSAAYGYVAKQTVAARGHLPQKSRSIVRDSKPRHGSCFIPATVEMLSREDPIGGMGFGLSECGTRCSRLQRAHWGNWGGSEGAS